MSEVLCRTPAGDIRAGDGFKYRRRRDFGHLTATGVDHQHRWIFARDSRGLARTIQIDAVVRICDPPKPPKQRENTKPPKRRRRR